MFNQIFQTLKESLDRTRTKNFVELPSRIKTDLAKYLKPGEEILLTLLNFRAIYKAPTLMDSNTFFNSWLTLTNSRIIIAKNSSKFNKFRDISHSTIDQVYYETGALGSTLTIHSPGSVDKIMFLSEARRYCEDLDAKVNKALEEAKKHSGLSDTIFCSQCRSKIPKGSKFCPQCGTML
jgi:zinc ribbon protein/PH (Pleckstrin Homology) domain-containing protein